MPEDRVIGDIAGTSHTRFQFNYTNRFDNLPLPYPIGRIISAAKFRRVAIR